MNYTHLRDRSLFSITGPDSAKFLQGLITNDVQKAINLASIYSCILTPQGKYFADFFMRATDDGYLLEVHAELLESLVGHLKRYRLRAQVTIEPVNDVQIYALDSPVTDSFADPRLAGLGYRLWSKTPPSGQEEIDFYHSKRIELGVAEGVYDLQSGKSFPPEFGLDQLNAIDYQKGCYVGQELIARTKYRGTLHKSLYQISGTSLQPGQEILNQGGHQVGHIYSCYQASGLAIIRNEEVSSQLFANGHEISTKRPQWWA